MTESISRKPKIDNPGCEECPICKNISLPLIKPGSMANARCCSVCGAIVDRNGIIENREKCPTCGKDL